MLGRQFSEFQPTSNFYDGFLRRLRLRCSGREDEGVCSDTDQECLQDGQQDSGQAGQGMLAQGAAAEDRFQCVPQSDGQNHQVSVVLLCLFQDRVQFCVKLIANYSATE